MADITVEELKTKIDNKDKFKFIDVREPYEYEMFNLNSELIPIGSFASKIEDLEAFKSKEIVLLCKSGKRSGFAKQILLEAGFTNPRNVIGGLLAWIAMDQS